MKVERKGKKVFEPIVITLETEKEVKYIDTIACIMTNQTLTEACKSRNQSVEDVNHFGAELTRALYHLTDC